jgi:ATP-binding cassette subfamily C (CFTR/MRP) protein 1
MGSTTDDENKHSGLIAWVDFQVYLKVFGTTIMITVLVTCAIGSAVLAIVQNIWLAQWSDTDKASEKYLIVYAAIGCGSALTVAVQTIVLTLCALRASRMLHGTMLDTLIDAPIRFFDANPVGRIQNRFLQDLANVDNFVPNSLLDVTTKTLSIFSQVALVLLFAPWVACVLPILLPIYYMIFIRVRCAARDTRRIESVAHSPCYTLFGDMLSGRATIASFRAESRFERLNLHLVVEMATAKYANEAVCKWAQALTTQTGSALYCAVGIVCVVLNHFNLLSASHFGVVMLYASTLQRAMMDYMMCLTTLETQFVSVPLVPLEYTHLSSAAPNN